MNDLVGGVAQSPQNQGRPSSGMSCFEPASVGAADIGLNPCRPKPQAPNPSPAPSTKNVGHSQTTSDPKGVRVLGPGSQVPVWVDALDSAVFGAAWGPVGEDELLWLMGECAFARWRVAPRVGEAELLRIAVATENRRLGAAKRLMAECSKALAAEGCRTLHLEVRVSNTPAQKLYEALSWRKTGLRKAYYGNGEDALLYGLGHFDR